jgi:hypothetical protein
MALAYHAEDPRPILEAYAAAYSAQLRPVGLLPAVGRRPRVGGGSWP